MKQPWTGHWRNPSAQEICLSGAFVQDGQMTCTAGSARAVNRRYIAMYVARKDRTNASALFVSLSAVGMALGPLLALPLSHVPEFKLFGALRSYPGDVTHLMLLQVAT